MKDVNTVAEHLPTFPYGAVYFRKSNPPKEDWERDYCVASEDGINVFRHWFMWSAIEVAPGKYDWDDYDRQFDLAAKYGLKTIVAELIHAAPEWAFHQYAHARYEKPDGSKVHSLMRNSSVTGGFPGLCLDNEDVKELAGRFLTELVNRYKDHPGMGAYDIWNESNLTSSASTFCHCPATAEKFREWLQRKYGDLKALGEAWYRHSYTEWEQVVPPRTSGPYPDYLDWVGFRIDNAYRLMKWRADLTRQLDPVHMITAHGVGSAPLYRMAEAADDHWRAAALVDGYGFTFGLSHGNEPWKQYHVVDMVRSGASGKPFWHAEAVAGPNWNWSKGQKGRPREDGRIPTPEDVRLWNMTSLAAGVRGIMYNRWRPLLDGPLFGALGGYDLDGSRTPRSEMMSSVAKWANDPRQHSLWQSKPVEGDIGIIFAPESAIHSAIRGDDREDYPDAARGAYQGFFDSNIQADWVHIEGIEAYRLLYLPHPMMLSEASANALIRWVENGGYLVSEGCPAFFGDRGRTGVVQPNLGLDRLFGATQEYVEFVPDLLEDLVFEVEGVGKVHGGLYLQSYRVKGGASRAVGWYDDGRIAAVENAYGKGRTRLVGTVPGYGYDRHPDQASRKFFSNILLWAGKEQHVRLEDSRLTARLHHGEGGTYLWVTNPTKEPLSTRLEFSETWGPFQGGEVLWGEDCPDVGGRVVTVTVPKRDALVMRLVNGECP